MNSSSPTTLKASELRRVFDQARAVPSFAFAETQNENLLAIRVSRDPYAIRANEISGLATDRKIVAFPSPFSELLGVAGVRGALVPVYSLAALLGYDTGAEQARWLALCGIEEPFALAFKGLEGYARVPQTQLYPAEQKDATRTFVTHMARAADTVRGVLSIPSLRQVIQERCRNGSTSKER